MATLAEFEASDEKLRDRRRAAGRRLRLAAPTTRGDRVRHRDRAVRRRADARAGARKQEQVSDVEALIKDLSELKVGDPVVHAQPRHRPLPGPGQHRPRRRARREFLHLEYADKATLYVPVAQLHLISRYTGVSADEAPLHKLGSGQWDKAKRKAAEQVRDTAAELLNLYARRAAREGHAFRFSPHDYEAFADELRLRGDARPARRDPRRDPGHGRRRSRWTGWSAATSASARPRSRCAPPSSPSPAASRSRILAPTTLLAEQHFQTIADRFGKWPVKVAELSRFRSAKEVNGGARRAWPTARSTSSSARTSCCQHDVKFKRLGLLIIDEEHRFGVRHKEAIKAMRAEVDVLTLTATPIPRTLGMALEGLRDLSVIATAPQRRLAIKTFVRNEGNGIDPRGGAARAQARRPGLLPAQRGRDHREPARDAGRSCCPRRASPSRTARCPSASSSA